MTDEALALEARAQWIKQTLLEYARGGEDRIEECRELGGGLDWVEDLIEKAEGLRQEWDAQQQIKAEIERARVEVLFYLPSKEQTQIKQAEPEVVVEASPKPQSKLEAPSALPASPAPSIVPAAGGLRRLPKTEPAVEATTTVAKPPEPAPEPPEHNVDYEEPAGSADEGVGAFVDDEEDLDANPPVLRYKAPYENARAFARRCCYQEGFLSVRYWQEGFWRWNGLTYEPLSAQTVRDMVYKFLASALVRVHSEEGPKLSKFDVNQHYVNQLIDAFKSGVGLSAGWYPPIWLDRRERAPEVIVFVNGVLNIRTRELWKPSPRLWVHGAVGFEWNPEAKCPTWERFLLEIHPKDEESWQAIDEMNGVCMTQDTRFEKAWALIGETRGGKGTLIKLLEALVGSTCFVSVSFNDWMKGKALQALLGKTVIALPDVRLRRGKWYGMNYDPGGLDTDSVELLLKITSGDKVSIPQMYEEAWEGKLPGKVVLASNQVPNFNDPVLPDRFIKLLFGQSFKDREDVTLLGRLKAELPGIAARAMKAYWRACERGRVLQPKTGLELKDAIDEEADPVAQFVKETFVIDPAGEVEVSPVWMRWETWCLNNGRPDLLRSINKKGGIKHLRRVPGLLRIRRVRPHGEKYKYTMLRWKAQATK